MLEVPLFARAIVGSGRLSSRVNGMYDYSAWTATALTQDLQSF